ncbi:hypothetical protein [Rossellomorea sp. BNER]|uniref:hypothetical protein n=1 Tax=Rossellomorea sp. BNER TaxID=2962031 RepID=UPI003AF2B28E|nr:hypothetical protein [Rossellomorea sp. BNER]
MNRVVEELKILGHSHDLKLTGATAAQEDSLFRIKLHNVLQIGGQGLYKDYELMGNEGLIYQFFTEKSALFILLNP